MKKTKMLLVFLLMLLVCSSIFVAGCKKKHAHDYVYTTIREASCSKEGELFGVCSCGEKITIIIPKIEHTPIYGGEYIEPTCTTPGYTRSVMCSICGEQISDGEKIEKLGHKYGEWIEVTASTETVKGEKRRDCDRCGRSEYGELPLKGDHNYVNVGRVEATCSQKGYTVYECTDCKDSYFDDFTPTLDHELVDYGSVSTSCTEDSYVKKECTVCKTILVIQINLAQGHSFGAWETLDPVSCEENGSEQRICMKCGEKELRTTVCVGHNFVRLQENESTWECTICGKILEETITPKDAEIYLRDIAPDFSFYIKANGTDTYSEAYIRENLVIYNTMFMNTEYLEEYGKYPYVIEEAGENRWKISAKEGALYEKGNTYNVILSGDLFMEEYQAEELVFTVKNEVKNIVSITSNVIFLSQLERDNPGYNASEPLFDEEHGLMYITVWKTDQIEVGDILYIGNATCEEELLSLDEEGHFGKVQNIMPNDREEFIIVLTAPTEDEIFEELDIYYEGAVDFALAEDLNEEIGEQAAQALVASEDFNNFLAASEVASNEYLAGMNLVAKPLTSKEREKALEIKPDFKLDGKKVIISLYGRLEKDVELADDGVKAAGVFYIEFKATVIFEIDISLNYSLKRFWGIPYGIKNFNFTLNQTDRFTFNFGIGFDMNCSNILSDFVYYDAGSYKTIHVSNCFHVDRIKDESKVKNFTLEELAEALKDPNYRCCKTCNPKEMFDLSTFMLCTESKTIHTTVCDKSKIEPKNLAYSTEGYSELSKNGYTPCEHCKPEEKKFGFSKLLMAANSGNLESTLKQIKKWTSASESNNLNNNLDICVIRIPIFEVISVMVDVKVVIDFKLELSLTYDYDVTNQNTYGIYLANKKIKSFHTEDKEVLKNELTLSGSISSRIGIKASVGVGITGLEKWISLGMFVEAGVYNEIEGILHKNFVTDDFYAAAYFESGLYLEIGAYYNLIVFRDEITIAELEIPLLTLGYDQVYYSFVNKAPEIEITESSYSLNTSELLSVNYYNLKEHTSGTTVLKETASNGVKITYEFEDGSYLTYKNGIILVKEGADVPCIFEDVLRVKVSGNSDWTQYKKGSVAVQLADLEIFVKVVLHDIAYVEGEDPTCTEEGLSSSEKCARCQLVLKEAVAIPALGHNYVDGVCSRCGKLGETPSEYFIFTLLEDGTYSIAAKNVRNMPAEIVLPATYESKPVTVIADNAFKSCYSLTSVEIPKSITTIGERAFYYCDSLTSVVIPNSVITIGEGAFARGTSLTNIAVDEDSKYYTSIDGNLYNYDKTILMQYAIGKTDSSFEIPNFVTYIGDYAFAFSDNLTSVEIGNSVTTIGEWAFEYCYGLTDIVIPGCVKEIQAEAFNCCLYLVNVTIEDGVEIIGEGAFSSCHDLANVTMPSSVTTIRRQAFGYCENLTSITIPESVNFIGGSVFYNCEALTVYCEAKSKPSEWDKGWDYCSGFSSSNCPVVWNCNNNDIANDGIVYTLIDGVRYGIKDNEAGVVFQPKNVTSVKIASVIEYKEKSYCVTHIAPGAFNDCDVYLIDLEDATNLKTIGTSAFYLSRIGGIILPDSVVYIGDNAFSGCLDLRSIWIGKGVSSIGKNAFLGCDSLEAIYVNADNASYKSIDGDLYSADGKTLIFYTENYFFEEHSFTIPNTVTTISDYAFANCSSLTSVVIPDSVTSIGEYAFAYCRSLTSVVIGNSVTSIGDGAFISTAYYKDEDNWENGVLYIGNYLIEAKNDISGECIIKDGTLCIADEAFWNCGSLTSVVIPDSTTSIGNCVFLYCYSLTNIEVDKDNKHNTSIDGNLYNYDKTTLIQYAVGKTDTSFEIPNSVTSIGSYAFAYCDSLTSVVIPDSVTSIEGSAFYSCRSLTSVVIPDSVTSIGDYVFQYCSSLTSIVIPDSVTSIGDYAFHYCRSLTSVVIPGSVTSIGRSAFSYCKSLTSVEIPDSVTSIGDSAFAYCENLTSVIIPESVTYIGKSAFYGCPIENTVG